MTTPTLYVVPGSHPSMTGRLMLEHKQIRYRQVDLLPAIHKPLLHLLGFSGTTVPALRIDGRRIQNTTLISRALEQLRPKPPLFPTDQEHRVAVEEAERWGERTLQPVPRRLSWWALGRDHAALRGFAVGARLHVPIGPAVRLAGPIVWIERRVNAATDEAIKGDLAELGQMLNDVDALIAAGTLGGAELNAADYQIATSIRLLLCFEDLREPLEARPCGTYARGVVPRFPGRVSRVIPPEWLAQATV